jgi:hypothetical protein
MTKLDEPLSLSCPCLIFKNKRYPYHFANLDWTPSATGLKGAKLDGSMEKLCSSVDSCWNCHTPSWFHHILQLMRWDLDLLCSTLSSRSPTWNKSSTLGIYNLTKWLGDTASLGTQMSPNLGTLLCLSTNKGVTVRKIGGVVELRL